MAERLIDVLDSSGAVIHTYPITLSDSAEAADEAAYKIQSAGGMCALTATETARRRSRPKAVP
jgi:hypothetical protein